MDREIDGVCLPSRAVQYIIRALLKSLEALMGALPLFERHAVVTDKPVTFVGYGTDGRAVYHTFQPYPITASGGQHAIGWRPVLVVDNGGLNEAREQLPRTPRGEWDLAGE